MMNSAVTGKSVPDELLNDTNFRFSEHFRFRSLLGHGGFGIVVLATSKSTCENMAVKIIDKETIGSVEVDKIKGEAEMLNSLDNKHIVKFKQLHEGENKLYIAMEHLSGGSLTDYIQKHRESGAKIRDIDASRIVKGVLEAVAYLHSFDTAHRDLKPDNIMFGKQNDFGSLKLIDFGLSAKYNSQQSTILADKCGTAIFMAPEVFSNHQYTKSVDLWSVGMIMYILIAGRHPLYESGEGMDKYIAKLKAPVWTFPPHFSSLAQHLFTKLTTLNPLERYTAKEALAHPWITRQPGKIPLSFSENIAFENARGLLINALWASFFAANVGTSSGQARADEEYAEKMAKISAMVSEWHDSQKVSTTELESDEEIYKAINSVFPFPKEEEDKTSTRQHSNEMCRLDLFRTSAMPSSQEESSGNGDIIDLSEVSHRKGSEYSASPSRSSKRMGSNSPGITHATTVHRSQVEVFRHPAVKARPKAAEGNGPLDRTRVAKKDNSFKMVETRPRANSMSPVKKGRESSLAVKHKRSMDGTKRMSPRNGSPPVQTEELKYIEASGFTNYASSNSTEIEIMLGRKSTPIGSQGLKGRETMPPSRKAGRFDALLPGGGSPNFQLPAIDKKPGLSSRAQHSPHVPLRSTVGARPIKR